MIPPSRARATTLNEWPPKTPPSSRSIRIASRMPAPARAAVESAWQAASRLATDLRERLGARAVLVHAHDGKELRVIGASGPSAGDLLGVCEHAASDFVASTLRERRSLTMCFDREIPRFAPQRFRDLRLRRALVAVPVVVSGACVAIVEVMDPGGYLKHAATECERVAALLADVIH